MKMIRDYFTLTNKKYMFLSNIVIPAGLGVVNLILSGHILGFMFAPFIVIVFIVLDGMMDYMNYSNIYQKGSMGMEFLKTSFDGIGALKNSIRVDMMTRFCRDVIFMLLGVFPIVYAILTDEMLRVLIPQYIDMSTIIWILIIAMLLLFFEQITVANIGRFMSTAQMVYILNGLFLTIYMLITAGAVALVVLYGIKGVIVDMLISVILAVSVIFVSERVMNKRIEMSYSDL